MASKLVQWLLVSLELSCKILPIQVILALVSNATYSTILHVHDNITHACTRAHTHTFNGPLSGTTQVSRYQKGKTNLDFTEARDSAC